ncbi:nucleoside hydrolase [Kamptonema cortianum]|nr:nucleoside hydrolase [Kamptonema cortianum]
MRKFIIDTDTASDDAVALIMALREPDVHVEAITVVCGNLSVDQACRNARATVEVAATYQPPIYRGASQPLLRPLFTSEFVHGRDGMGDMNLDEPALALADGHAVDRIIEIVMANPGEIEIITLGPLTNLALAVAKVPEMAAMVRRVWIMGGTGYGPGNVTPVAEFNLYVDAEAAQIVLNSGLPLTFVGWDCSTDETFITLADIDHLLSTGSPIAQFCVRCNAVLQRYNLESWGRHGFDLPDPVTVAAALYPDIITEQVTAYSYMEYRSPDTYGQLVIDRFNLHGKPANATFCLKVDPRQFKQKLFARIC